MTRLILAALLAALPLTADAYPRRPPAHFDHEYQGHVELRRLHPLDITEACNALIPEWRGIALDGCSTVTAGGCLILMVDRPTSGTKNKREMQTLYLHERAHCNGWRH